MGAGIESNAERLASGLVMAAGVGQCLISRSGDLLRQKLKPKAEPTKVSPGQKAAVTTKDTAKYWSHIILW